MKKNELLESYIKLLIEIETNDKNQKNVEFINQLQAKLEQAYQKRSQPLQEALNLLKTFESQLKEMFKYIDVLNQGTSVFNSGKRGYFVKHSEPDDPELKVQELEATDQQMTMKVFGDYFRAMKILYKMFEVISLVFEPGKEVIQFIETILPGKQKDHMILEMTKSLQQNLKKDSNVILDNMEYVKYQHQEKGNREFVAKIFNIVNKMREEQTLKENLKNSLNTMTNALNGELNTSNHFSKNSSNLEYPHKFMKVKNGLTQITSINPDALYEFYSMIENLISGFGDLVNENFGEDVVRYSNSIPKKTMNYVKDVLPTNYQ